MIGMKSAIVLFVSSVISCLFFTLGRWVGKVENKNTVSTDKKSGAKKEKTRNFSRRSKYNDGVIDAVYEDVVDLQEYRIKKAHVERSPASYEWMFSKSENTYVKVPREIAEIIRSINKDF